jgi:hypothetical protein
MRVKSAVQFVVAAAWAIGTLAQHPEFWRGGINVSTKMMALLVNAFTGLFVLAAIEFLARALCSPSTSQGKPSADTKPEARG